MTTELAVKQSLTPSVRGKLSQAKAVWAAIQDAEGVLGRTRNHILNLAHKEGGLLNQLKEEVGHGNWLTFLFANFGEMGRSELTIKNNAERCMKLFRENPKALDSNSFTAESVRKFMWGYVPVKERKALEGDQKDAPQQHYLTFVNNFWKWDRQVQIGQTHLPSIDVLRHDLTPTLERLIDICGKEYVRGLL